MTSVWDKLEDILQFVHRVLDDQNKDLETPVGFEGGGCSNYHNQLLLSREATYREARKAAEKGLEILQSATMHLICAACFVCTIPRKTEQVDEFTRRALHSLQDRMGAIFSEQLAADQPPDPACSLRYVASLSEGLSFPSWGRFTPEMDGTARGLLGTFTEWLDRVLSLLLELPGTLLFQRSVLRLAFHYAERPESDASALLHGPPKPVPAPTPQVAAAVTPLGLCPPGPRRLLVAVPRHLPAAGLKHARTALEAAAPAWHLLWVASARGHAEALRLGPEDAGLLWRRFPAGDLDALAAALCDGEPAWVADLAELEDAGAAGEALQRLAVEPQLADLEASSWPRGSRPAAPLPRAEAWPAGPLREYLQGHSLFRSRLGEGLQQEGSKVLIYTCTSMTFCGGHGDRLNGMLSAAVVALLSGRFFFIDSQRPVPLSLVLEPSDLDWRLFGTHAALPAAFNWNDNLEAFEADPRRALDHQAEVLRFVSNQRLTPGALRTAPRRAEALGLTPNARLHALLFHMLFRPSPALQHRLAARALPDGRLIGVHFRAGDQMPEHWSDPPRHALEEVEEFLACAEHLEASLGWNARFLLFADTDRLLGLPKVAALRESGKLLWSARDDELVHLDRSPATLTVRGMLGVWADWWTLAFDVHALVISHSGFGATALEVGPPRPAVLGKGCIKAEGSTG